jgi:hypothetical protein
VVSGRWLVFGGAALAAPLFFVPGAHSCYGIGTAGLSMASSLFISLTPPVEWIRFPPHVCAQL